MENTIGLQKLTVTEILEKESINNDDLNQLSNADKKKFNNKCGATLSKLKCDDRDKFLKKIWGVVSEEGKKAIWSSNHEKIKFALHNSIKKEGYFPNASRLVELTGLSRQTIYKHLNTFKDSELYNEYRDACKVLESNVIQLVYQLAMNGDLKACKLFLELSGAINRMNPSTYIDKQQNNIENMNM